MRPGRILETLDREYPLERFGKSFTIVYLILNIKTGRLRYSNAGHPPPLVLGQDAGIQVLERGGTIIGLGGVLPFEGGEVMLRPGDKIILYTDGVVEYENPDGGLWGEERFRRLLSEKRQLPVTQILEKVWETLATFGVGESPRDDVSLMGLEFKGKSERPG
jgi:sigma-B regulation protein RsbU (phosphoserine phosphatase)